MWTIQPNIKTNLNNKQNFTDWLTARKYCKKCPTSDQLMLLFTHGGGAALLPVSVDNQL